MESQSQIISEKNKKLYLIDSFKFYFQKCLCSDIETWACSKRSCKSYIKLNSEHKMIFSTIIHNYDKDDEQKFNRQQFCNNSKRKALDNPFEKPCKILPNELLNRDISTWTTANTIRVRKNVHYARSSAWSKLPNTLNDLHNITLDNLNVKTNQFLFINDHDKNVVAFSTQKNVKYLNECEILFVDGTLKI